MAHFAHTDSSIWDLAANGNPCGTSLSASELNGGGYGEYGTYSQLWENGVPSTTPTGYSAHTNLLGLASELWTSSHIANVHRSPCVIQHRCGSGRTGNGGSSAAVNGHKKPRRRVATVAQRRAANIRERRRMFNLNEAFDKLRRKVPTFAYEKRLSRIETLRLAITYISFMNELLNGNGKSCSSDNVRGPSPIFAVGGQREYIPYSLIQN